MASSHNKRTEPDSKRSSFMVFIAGAHSAGKTSVVFFPRKLENQHDSLYTMGLEIQIVPINNNSVILLDEGGRSAGRALQRAYYRRMTGIIYVVDSSDRTTIEETCNELHQLANEEGLRTKPFLILANKQDLPTAMTLDELKVKLNLVKLDGIKKWHLHPTCAIRGEGVREGLGWLIDAMKSKDDGTTASKSSSQSQCRKGGKCDQIGDKNHCREYEHPSFCPDGGRCKKQTEDHLKMYRHLPLCPQSHKCIDYLKEVKEHCDQYRHFAPYCPYGNNCALFHDKSHFEDFQHPFPPPCPHTPFECPMHSALCESKNNRSLSTVIQQHCLNFAHVCKLGRNCLDQTQLHQSRSIHIARQVCPYGEKCSMVSDEEHINTLTHPHIPDIRPLCPYRDDCREPDKLEHRLQFRHHIIHEPGVVRYYGTNKQVDFVQNHRNNVECVSRFVSKQNWKPLPSGIIPDEIVDWIRTVQPIHRCNLVIFESILLHGHVMSREYMEHLKDPTFVANSVLHHSRIRRIDALKIKTYEEDARKYVTALVCLEFGKQGFLSKSANPEIFVASSFEDTVRKKENKLSGTIPSNDMRALRSKAIDIARASIKLHSDPAGIGYASDKALGTDKLVFSILGPHMGHYYGDIIIIFKREILHHCDANFSMQAATSFVSGRAYTMRPWLGKDPGSTAERVKHYHATKLHAGVPGYEHAAALELMALTSSQFNLKSMDITLDQILQRWLAVDSHQTIEAHLPQLIPLDYIDHIYMPRSLFDHLSEDARRAVEAVFSDRITIADHKVELTPDKGTFGATPSSKARADYQEAVVRTILQRYKKYTPSLALSYLRGITMTIPSTNLDEHYVLPLTISQAYAQYNFEEAHPSKDNITHIYWKALHGDMMLTLSSEKIDLDVDQSHLRCLICYVAAKPIAIDDQYHEPISYLAVGHPFQHEIITSKKKYAVKTDTFYTGCNNTDYFTYCLELHLLTGFVVLAHAGPNALYSRGIMCCRFSRSDLDLTKLNFIHVSAGNHKVPMKNLVIHFTRQPSMHPTFDKSFGSASTASTSASASSTTEYDDSNRPTVKSKLEYDHMADKRKSASAKTPKSPLKPCKDSIYCLLQYSSDVPEHNLTYSHPCRYSELCSEREPHLTHEPHRAPKCDNGRSCDKLDDPVHRAAYRHTNLPDFLIPCFHQSRCNNKSSKHRKDYFHGERVLDKITTTSKTAKADDSDEN
ncbi:unnamed protein product [Adineta ricciae]|uniref:C3H1-type domain-containing protein n=1 Tax=Adineta ricciae TaxID=249248 RepID=A0A813YHP1_ADIRI|nr:unnamed protein product [Adineta ricciae]